LESPLGIDVPAPRFSYALLHSSRGQFQSVYEIVVSYAPNGAVVWDSGKVSSNVTTNIPYAGSTALKSDTDYTWTVTWWDSTGAASTPATGTFSTGLYTPADWQGAQYVGGENVLRAQFTVTGPSVTRARLYILGLGYYRSWLNSVPTDPHVLGTFTTFESRQLYDAWDVTALVQPGCNTLGVMLGAGWYAQETIKAGPRSLLTLLSVDTSDGTRTYYPSTLANGTASSISGTVGLSFTVAAGPVTYDDIYNGEIYDARLLQAGWASCGFANASAWAPATPVPVQNASVLSWHTVPILVDSVYTPVAISEPLPGSGQFVIDFGQNIAGQLTTNVICPNGPQWIYYYFGESLHQDGTVLNQYGGIMRANFTCAGTGDLETYTTLFSYYGFRYVQLTNWPGVPNEASFSALFTHTAVPPTGEFNSDNVVLNKIQHCHRYASLSNLMDVPTDCPQRERRGWLGDAQLSAETTISNFDMAAFYTKFLRDIRDSQLFYTPSNNGSIPDCVPFYGHGGLPADPAWSAAYPLITDWVSGYYADDSIVSEHYDGIKAFMESQIRQLDNNGVLSFARYGDWCSVANGAGTGCGFTRPDISTFYFIQGLRVLTDFANRLGNTADAAHYGAIANRTSSYYNQLWYNAAGSYYQDGYPISQVLALEGGFAGTNATAVFNTLVGLINSGKFSGFPNAPTGGIVFTKYSWPVLTEGGRIDLALQMFLATGMPSFDHWIEGSGPNTGATTLWENWQSTNFNPYGSYNHIMYGGGGKWLYSNIAGLGRDRWSRGWTNLRVEPPNVVLANVSSAAASIDTAIGLAQVSWTTAAPSGTCGYVQENSVLNLTCLPLHGQPNGLFTGVKFASFGTPAGSCPSFSVGSCNSDKSVSTVTAACVGKASCTLPATNDFFGGDPCLDTPKALAVSLAGNCGSILLQLSVTIPVGATATVAVPTFGTPIDQISVMEGTSTVYTNGAYVPGVPGITGAAAVTERSGGVVVEVYAGSGSYVFSSSS